MAPLRIRFGIIVPSSNTAMEPLITSILETVNACIPSVYTTAHFSRFRVTQISLDASAHSQFDLETILHAASLLADAKVDAILWGGTSAGWLGLDNDRQLCQAIEARFGILAHTSTLAVLEYLQYRPDRPKLGLVTPYIKTMNDAIQDNFAKEGVTVISAEQCLSITDNVRIAEVTAEQLTEMVDITMSLDVTTSVIAVYCTNLSAAQLVTQWEDKHRQKTLCVLDSVSIGVWGLLRKVGISTAHTGIAARWGRIFNLSP